MLFRKIKTPGLAQHSYLLECGGGQAVVIDPRRDIDAYLRLARENALQLTYILETHRQEDFEYGSASLAQATGASIVTGAHELFGRSDLRLHHAQELRLGSTRFVALATPGHTPESLCYAVYREDAGSRCWGVFTGDTLFVGETGRTDLAGDTAENAGRLFDSVHRDIEPLGDQALVFPAHGSGSACGGHISARDESSVGIEKHTNPVFRLGRQAFIAHKLAERLPRPPYFSHMERVNLHAGRSVPALDAVRTLQPVQFRKTIEHGIVIDARTPDAFAAAHIPGSYNVWAGGLAPFAGWIADENTSMHLVLESPADVQAAMLSLARIGLDRVQGVLAGGISAWREQGLPIQCLRTIGARQAADWIAGDHISVLDVRDELEWHEGHIAGATHVYVGDLERRLPALPKEQPILVHCSVGNRSGLAASILARNGYTSVCNLLGGMKAWRALDLPVAKEDL